MTTAAMTTTRLVTERISCTGRCGGGTSIFPLRDDDRFQRESFWNEGKNRGRRRNPERLPHMEAVRDRSVRAFVRRSVGRSRPNASAIRSQCFPQIVDGGVVSKPEFERSSSVG